MSSLLTTGEILATRDAIDPVFLDSPSMRHLALDDALGCAVTLKVETLNTIRSFKGRGTEAVLAAGAAPGSRGHRIERQLRPGRGMGHRGRGIVATVFAPAGANPLTRSSAERTVALIPEHSGSRCDHLRQLDPSDGDMTLLVFGHRNWREQVEFMVHCSMKWAVFLLSLRQFSETGKGQPSPDDLKIDNWN